MRIGELFEHEEPTRIKLGAGNAAAQAWIEKVYARYPQTFQNNHVMPLGGSGDDQQFAMFELVPSFSKRGAVVLKFFQAYPLRSGVGSRAMKELQSLAKEDGISLTLFPWDKGQVSQSKLTKFYRGQGFTPSVKGGKAMQWSPELAEGKIKLSTYPDLYGAEVGNYKASGPVVNIPSNQLAGFEPDDKMNQPASKANVEKIVAGLKQGAKLPPLMVRQYKNGYQVLDGHHRFWAYKLLGVKSIPAQVVPAEDIEEITKQGVAEDN
jgi:hypothetical protein